MTQKNSVTLYPEKVFPFNTAPGNNEVVDIAPGVKWLRSPLPLSLDHINCYLLKDDDGWCVVDTGMNSKAARDHWLDIIESHCNNEPITRVIVTHQHPDHVGLAGWLCESYRARLLMSEQEYLCSRVYLNNGQADSHWEVEEFFQRTAMSAHTLDGLTTSNNFYDSVSTLPGSYHQLRDHQRLAIGANVWEVIITRGHAQAHVSLYCEALDLYISGDQVLPRITSNVSVISSAPESSPLTDWYEAHEVVAERVPDSVLVLPAHELPFHGVQQRLREVIEHHEERLLEILDICDTPQNAQAITNTLFAKEFDAFQNYLAVGECLAHLHRLMEQGKIVRQLQKNVYLYQRV